MPKKESKPLDSRTIRLFEKLQETRQKQKERDFHKWLKRKNEDGVPNTKFILWFMDEIKIILNHFKYDITNEKRFKDELATFIYKLSEH